MIFDTNFCEERTVVEDDFGGINLVDCPTCACTCSCTCTCPCDTVDSKKTDIFGGDKKNHPYDNSATSKKV